MSGLGLLKPPDQAHIEQYPLDALGAEAPSDVPVVCGIDWMTNFDNPREVDGLFVIGEGNLGSIRGGHCICADPPALSDEEAWWIYYNQGQTGHCVGFGTSRAQSLLKRVEFDATWLYNAARAHEGNTSSEEGSTVRAAMAVLRKTGTVPEGQSEPVKSDGVKAYRWAKTWDEVRATLGVPAEQDGIDLLQSWGQAYPEKVRLVDAAGEKLIAEGGEFAVFTER